MGSTSDSFEKQEGAVSTAIDPTATSGPAKRGRGRPPKKLPRSKTTETSGATSQNKVSKRPSGKRLGSGRKKRGLTKTGKVKATVLMHQFIKENRHRFPTLSHKSQNAELFKLWKGAPENPKNS
ncbi:hypothetical protein AOQ84DRAFT_391173 [Glonium stellatum]|uniref:Uncharacterized protein n=1 Tax=Glonium stellatum TaxID=574774 RepID=A0A8E2EUB1_9PEZI|nr:hypothetical protein AOQ84DRAFT_391173 [Glonium stellatum]